jgi:S-adenosyl methyltransferase
MDSMTGRARGLYFSKPNVARVYDYLLGGIESYHADREQAAALLRIRPSLGVVALENRYFIARAVNWAAKQGITQFIDLGAGVPVHKPRAGVLEDIHVTAQAASREARVAYVDDDPVVLARSRAFRGPAKGVAVAEADLTDPDAVLTDRGLRAVIELAQPVCLVFGLVLGLIPAARARDVVAGYARLAARGSCIVISCGRCDDEQLREQLSKAYTAADTYNHTRAEVGGFLAGLDPVPPGIVATQNWLAGRRDIPADIPMTPPGPVYVLGGVAQKG